jgi:hypothetical protein
MVCVLEKPYVDYIGRKMIGLHFKPCALFCFVQVLELNLDNCRTTGQVEGLTESFINLDYLSLNNAGLTSLKNFPKLPNLRRVSAVLFSFDPVLSSPKTLLC